jgi:hypothetical protein
METPLELTNVDVSLIESDTLLSIHFQQVIMGLGWQKTGHHGGTLRACLR